MRTLYFFSGFDREGGFPADIGESLARDIINRKSLVFIATDPTGHEKTDSYAKVMVRWFSASGIEFEAVNVLDDRTDAAECEKLVKNASAVFLMGGRTLLQMQFITQNKLDAALREFDGVVMGLSAGAINMANFSFLAPYDGSPIMFKGVSIADLPAIAYSGIGLADISVMPHYDEGDKDFREGALMPFSDKIDIYAMCDGSAIMACGEKINYFGKICLISRRKITWISQ